ncbi:MAG: winged helix-turn-helix domain-containing protein [Actinomycetia bacterium]|nr:winged helix-turn-helix domain-containing protein [Actinomycetes bacterium]
MNQLKIFTLGALQVRVDGQSLDLGTPKQRALLALLVIERRRTVSADRIMIALWGPDAPPQRRKDVWVYVSRLRKSLGSASDVLRREPGGYVLDIDDAVVDSVAFEALVEEGGRLLPDDPAAASLVLGEALAAWSGGIYEEFVTNDFASAEIARMEEYRLLALEMRVQADLACRETDRLIPEIEGLAQAHPLRSNLTASLMLALYRRGRQVDALRAYDRYTKRLADETGLQPPEDLKNLEEQILLNNPGSHVHADALRTGLPERITPFVGRETDLTEVTQLISDHRLVTITGFGGVGKSALALEAARRLAVGHDVVALVDLTRVDPSGNIMSLVAEALHTKLGAADDTDALIDRIGNRRVLLVFDNCEHIVGEVSDAITKLLQGAAGLSVLATSRVLLGMTGERLVQLMPLSTEHGNDAELLLEARIADLPSNVRSTIGDDDRRSLCARTEGIPLAIELATAQLRTWSASEVIEAMEQPLDVLVSADRVGPTHHREMRTSIGWSERLLPPLAQVLLARLSVFRSGFTFDAVDPVVGGDPLSPDQVRNELRRLVDASLVTVRLGSPTRYDLLEPVRQYAAERLEDRGETVIVAERHLAYFADLFEMISPSIAFGTKASTLARASQDDANLLSAIGWAVRTDQVEAAQRLTTASIPLWRATVNLSDVLPTIDAVLGMSDSPSRTRAELLFRSFPLYSLARGSSAAETRMSELESTSHSLNDSEVAALVLLRHADAAASTDDPDEVIDMYRRAVQSLQESGSPYVINALHQLGWYQFWCWDRWDETKATIANWQDVTESLGSQNTECVALKGWVALAQAETEAAEVLFGSAARKYRRQGDHRTAALQMLPLAISSLQRGEIAEARRRIDVGVAATREAGALPWLQNTLMTRSYVKVALDDHRGAVQDLIEVGATIGEGDASSPAALARATASALATSHPDSAAALLGAANAQGAGEHMLRLTPLLVAPALISLNGDPESVVRESISADTFESAWTRGTSMDAATMMTVTIQVLEEACRAF